MRRSSARISERVLKTARVHHAPSESRSRDVARAALETAARGHAALATVSHDLKNPIGSILLHAAALLREAQDAHDVPSARRHAEAITRAAVMMCRLVEAILDTAMEGSMSRLVVRATCMATLVDDALDVLQPLVDEKEITLVRDVPRDLPLALVDGDRIAQVFSNLVGNALKFTPRGGTISIVARADGDAIRIAVTDSGDGIAPAELPRVFERFWRSAETRTSGVGLGLAIVKAVVEAHGGTVSVANVYADKGAPSSDATAHANPPRAGATFTFTVPMAVQASARSTG